MTPEQADGLACVECGATKGPQVPVGRSTTGSQVFACRKHFEPGKAHS